jgi:hypothetical protein
MIRNSLSRIKEIAPMMCRDPTAESISDRVTSCDVNTGAIRSVVQATELKKNVF